MSTTTTDRALTLSGAELEAAREVAAWAALYPLLEGDTVMDTKLEELARLAHVTYLMRALGRRPGEPAEPGDEDERITLDPDEQKLLRESARDMAGCSHDAITSGVPSAGPVTPAHATYYGAQVRTAERVLAMLDEEAGR